MGGGRRRIVRSLCERLALLFFISSAKPLYLQTRPRFGAAPFLSALGSPFHRVKQHKLRVPRLFFEFYLQNNRRDFFSAAKMGCGMSTEEKEGKARNEEIENQLKRDKMMQRNEIKMLLLGM